MQSADKCKKKSLYLFSLIRKSAVKSKFEELKNEINIINFIFSFYFLEKNRFRQTEFGLAFRIGIANTRHNIDTDEH